MYTLLYLKRIASKVVLCSTGNSAQCYVAALDERGVWGRMDTCIRMAESLHCPPETITTLFISYTHHGLQPTRLLCPWDFPGKSTGVGCHCRLWVYLVMLLNGIWPWLQLVCGLWKDSHTEPLQSSLPSGSCLQGTLHWDGALHHCLARALSWG